MVSAWTAEIAAGRVCEICDGIGFGKVYEHVWLFNTQVEGCDNYFCHHPCANDVHRASERDRFSLGLPVVYAYVLP